MVARVCRVIVIGQVAGPGRHQPEDPPDNRRPLSTDKPSQADIQRTQSACCRLRAQYEGASHPHQVPAK